MIPLEIAPARDEFHYAELGIENMTADNIPLYACCIPMLWYLPV